MCTKVAIKHQSSYFSLCVCVSVCVCVCVCELTSWIIINYIFIQCDCQVPLIPGQGGFPQDLEAHFHEVLSKELSCLDKINKIRAYITAVQVLPYEVPSELQKVSNEDYLLIVVIENL